MQIKEITIDNFKGIDNLTIKPKMINLIVGKNNTCKTSLLEAIDLSFNTKKIKVNYGKHISGIINIYSNESEISLLTDKNETKIKLRKPKTTDTSLLKKELIENFKKNTKEFHKKIKFTAETDKEMEKIVDDCLDEELISELLKESIIVVKDEKEKLYSSFGLKKTRFFLETIVKSFTEKLNKKFKIKIPKSVFFSYS